MLPRDADDVEAVAGPRRPTAVAAHHATSWPPLLVGAARLVFGVWTLAAEAALRGVGLADGVVMALQEASCHTLKEGKEGFVPQKRP